MLNLSNLPRLYALCGTISGRRVDGNFTRYIYDFTDQNVPRSHLVRKLKNPTIAKKKTRKFVLMPSFAFGFFGICDKQAAQSVKKKKARPLGISSETAECLAFFFFFFFFFQV